MSASNILLKERECYWIPHPSKVYVMVMIRRIEGDRCLVTTVEDKKDLELDIYYPFFPINSFVVDDMTALPNLHEVCIPITLRCTILLNLHLGFSLGRHFAQFGREIEASTPKPVHLCVERARGSEPPPQGRRAAHGWV